MNPSPESAAEPPSTQPPTASLRGTLAASLAIVALLSGASYWAWCQLPAGVRIPMHWDAAGKVNGYGGRGTLFIGPCVVLGLSLLLYLLPYIEPRREHLLRSSKAYKTVWLGVVLFLSTVQASIVLTALGHHVPMDRVCTIGMGVLFTVMGNLFGKIRSNFVFGVRTPWTLSSELAWNKTHRVAGWLFVILGLGIIAGGLAGVAAKYVLYAFFGFLPLMLVFVFVYSYRVWKSDPNKINLNAAKT